MKNTVLRRNPDGKEEHAVKTKEEIAFLKNEPDALIGDELAQAAGGPDSQDIGRQSIRKNDVDRGGIQLTSEDRSGAK